MGIETDLRKGVMHHGLVVAATGTTDAGRPGPRVAVAVARESCIAVKETNANYKIQIKTDRKRFRNC